MNDNDQKLNTKKIAIAYLPGFGGNFLESLFSLDSSTTPLWTVNGVDTPMSRVESYLNLRQNKKLMHLGDNDLKNVSRNLSDYRYLFVATHPEEFNFQMTFDHVFLVELDWSDFSNYWLMQSKENFDYTLARLRPDEAKKNLLIKKMFNTKTININCFLDESTWKTEYERINNLLELPTHYDAASRLYEFWYQLRVKNYVDDFKNISVDKYAHYCHSRLKEEIWGTATQWQIFYQRVRDPQWPECKDEKDFALLPEWIQEELIKVFGYQPQKQV